MKSPGISAAALALGATLGLRLLYPAAQDTLRGYDAASQAAELKWEQQARAIPDPAKIRAAMDSQMGSTRLSLESRLTAVSFEMERLHKLLNIRPTTSEFQHVVSSVSDVQRRMFDSVDELSKNVKAIVQEKVTNEMNDILQQMKFQEETQKKNNDLTMAKLDALSADILSLVGGDNSMIEVAVGRVSGEMNVLKDSMNNFKLKAEGDISGLLYAQNEMRFGQDMTRDMLNDYKVRDGHGHVSRQVSGCVLVCSDVSDALSPTVFILNPRMFSHSLTPLLIILPSSLPTDTPPTHPSPDPT